MTCKNRVAISHQEIERKGEEKKKKAIWQIAI